MLPLGKDLLHRIPAVLQTGVCLAAAPGQEDQARHTGSDLCLGGQFLLRADLLPTCGGPLVPSCPQADLETLEF